MLRHFVIIVLILLAVVPVAYSADATPVDSTNRFLSAELRREMDAMEQSLEKKLIENQDANARALDERMNELMAQTRMRVIIGGIGAILVANAIVAYLMLKSMRRYSYESFLEKELTILKTENVQLQANVQQPQMQQPQPPLQQPMYDPVASPYGQEYMQMQQPSYVMQEDVHTVADQFGQAAAANMSQMNSWQAAAPYEGAWKAPVETVKEYNKYEWEGKQ